MATLTETVQVTAESPIIDVKQNAAVGVDHRRSRSSAFRRRATSPTSIKTAPGTQQERKSGIQIDGAGGAEHRYVIDGMDTTGIRTGVSGQEMPIDFVQEVQVKSSGYNAEFRATTGGVISAITKTGSNAWHGGAGYYFRNNSFNGDAAADAAADARRSVAGRVHHHARRRVLAARADVRSGRADPAQPRLVLRRLRARTSTARAGR